MDYINIPKEVQEVINNPKYFDYLFLSNLEGRTSEDAFDYTVDYIRKYAPKWKGKTYRSYLELHRRDKSKELQIPKHVIKAVTDGIEDLMVRKLKTSHTRKAAYDEVVREIQRYFPNRKPYASYSSYKASMSHHHKVKRVARGRPRKK